MEIGPNQRHGVVASSMHDAARGREPDDGLAVALLKSLEIEIAESAASHPRSESEGLGEILDGYCLPLLGNPERLGLLMMLMGGAAARTSGVAIRLSRGRKRALQHLAGRIQAAQDQGCVPGRFAADSIANVAGTVVTGLCLTAFAEGRQPTLGEYRSVRDFLVSAFA